MPDMPIVYWQEKLGKNQYHKITFQFEITGAKTVSPLIQGIPVLTTFDAFASQAIIDNFLSDKYRTSSNEFLLAAFDATSMGADTFGGIVDMWGQVDKLGYMEAACYSGTDGLTVVQSVVKSSAALTASTLLTECAKSAEGNIGFKINFGNTPDFDGLTAGLIVVEFGFLAK